jgi:hypothetical protein
MTSRTEEIENYRLIRPRSPDRESSRGSARNTSVTRLSRDQNDSAKTAFRLSGFAFYWLIIVRARGTRRVFTHGRTKRRYSRLSINRNATAAG